MNEEEKIFFSEKEKVNYFKSLLKTLKDHFYFLKYNRDQFETKNMEYADSHISHAQEHYNIASTILKEYIYFLNKENKELK